MAGGVTRSRVQVVEEPGGGVKRVMTHGGEVEFLSRPQK